MADFTLEELLAEKERRAGTHVPLSALGKPDTTPPATIGPNFKPKQEEGAISSIARGAGAFADRAVDAATLGLYGKGLDWLQENVSPNLGSTASQRRNLPQIARGAADALGYLAPVGPAGKVGKLAGETGDALLNMVMRRRATSAAGKLAEKAATGAAAGALTNVGTGVAREGVTGEDQGSLWDMATHGAGLGAVVGGGAGLAGEGAALMKSRSPDLQLLEQHGLEPRLPLPGPAVRPIEGHPSPMEVPNKVTPAVRAEAGNRAAEEIVPAIKATEQANNRQFGARSRTLAAGEGHDLGTAQPLIDQIRALSEDVGNSEARPGLGRIHDLILEAAAKRGFTGKSGVSLTANDLNAIRQAAESEAGNMQAAEQGKPVKRGHLPFLNLAATARDLLTQPVSKPMIGPLPQPPAARPSTPLSQLPMVPGLSEPEDIGHLQTMAAPRPAAPAPPPKRPPVEQPLAPGIAELNADYAKTAEGVKRRYRLLGIPSPGTTPLEKTTEQAGRMITSRGEESKAAGARTGEKGHRIDRLEAMGVQPEVLPGTTVPEFPDAHRLLDRPTVLGAVERMQLSPPQAFNAAKSPSAIANLLTAAPNRTAYPALKALSKVEPGGNVVAGDQLIHSIQKRKKRGLEARE